MHHIPAEAFDDATLIPFPQRPSISAGGADGTALLARLMRLRRPRGLIAAARLGVAGYDRRRTLPRLLRQPDLPGPRAALARLLTLEAECEKARREGRAFHDVTRHVEVMIAALAEGRALALAGDTAGDAAGDLLPAEQ